MAARTLGNWIGSDLYAPCAVSDREMGEATRRARAEILRGVEPVPRKETPHLILTIGAPGVGKSTVAAAVGGRASKRKYAVLDFDLAVKYHPRYRDVWNVPTLAEKPSGVGLMLGYLVCNEALEEILSRLFGELLEKRYNIILQSHTHTDLIPAKMAGYRTTLLFVGTPLAVAQRRSRKRAVETGKFLAPTLRAQDELVESMWRDYRANAPWYGLWADEFLVADNRRAAKDDDEAGQEILKHVAEVPMRSGGDWFARVDAARAAIDAVYS